MTRRTHEVKHAKPDRDTGVRVWGVCNRERATGGTRDTQRKPISADGKGSSSPLMKKRREERKNQREKRSKEVNPLALLKLL